ncbi:MAG: hypothetical protein L3J54_13780, partial [Draconibacterium sp.]|nr:hypothetical protein [Draconibacterium sp.]
SYTIFLTSDHGVSEVPKFLTDIKVPSGYKSKKKTIQKVKDFTKKHFGEDLIENIMNNQVFLNHDKIKELKIDKNKVVELLIDEMITYKNIYKITSSKTLQNSQFSDGIMGMIQKGYNQKFSCDINLSPQVIQSVGKNNSVKSYIPRVNLFIPKRYEE